MIFGFQLGHNPEEATENVCCLKGESALNLCTIDKMVEKILLGLPGL